MGLFLSGLILAGCSTEPARDVAYDPFIPSALIEHRKSGAVSVAYRGGVAEIPEQRAVTRERSKEILVFDQ
jgi:hypothetical protein